MENSSDLLKMGKKMQIFKEGNFVMKKQAICAVCMAAVLFLVSCAYSEENSKPSSASSHSASSTSLNDAISKAQESVNENSSSESSSEKPDTSEVSSEKEESNGASGDYEGERRGNFLYCRTEIRLLYDKSNPCNFYGNLKTLERRVGL